MEKINLRLEYDEIISCLEKAMREKLKKTWGIPQDVFDKLEFKISLGSDFDGRVTHAEVEVTKFELED